VAVTVTPETFTMVFFDAVELGSLVERLAAEIGLPAALPITVEVDETTPLGQAVIESLDPLVLHLESGALEDPKRPRQLDVVGATDVLGRLLFEVRDRLDDSFGAPADASSLSLPQSVAWQVHCVGRLGRLGHHVQRQRRLYQFRNRHGFTDAADEAFARLWDADRLSWAEIDAISGSARALLAPQT
jgi:hypothetical protein